MRERVIRSIRALTRADSASRPVVGVALETCTLAVSAPTRPRADAQVSRSTPAIPGMSSGSAVRRIPYNYLALWIKASSGSGCAQAPGVEHHEVRATSTCHAQHEILG